MPIHSYTSLVLAALATAEACAAAPAEADPDKDPQLVNLLQEARHLIDGGKTAEAIPKCDAVINAFKTRYSDSTKKILCARTSAEKLGALLKAAADKTNAIALSSTWSDAYFMKGYALEDLHRLGEAKAALELALQLSPSNSQYLAEIGGIYALEKNWAKAEQAYQEAEDNAPLSPPASREDELGRARRGLGYVLVELGKLDEAEQKYQQCLAANPNDTKAKAELDYVREQKAKRKQP
jgi:tetratricopeptide (TPR) repeat protein